MPCGVSIPRQITAEVGQLARAFDVGVRGEDLLDQRRRRTRQADDEDDFAAERERAEREGLRENMRVVSSTSRVKAAASHCMLRAHDRVRARERSERIGVTAGVLETLPSGEVEGRARVVGGLADPREPLERGGFLRVEPDRLQIGETEPRLVRASPPSASAHDIRRPCPRYRPSACRLRATSRRPSR